MNEIIENMSDKEYFALDALNVSKLKPFARSINYGIWCDENKKETVQMNLGRLIHTFILEGEEAFDRKIANEYIVGGPINEKTGKCYGKDTQKYADWLAIHGNGKIAVDSEEIETIQRIAMNVARHTPSRELLEKCPRRELVLLWDDPVTGIPMKAKLDFVGERIAGDLKSSSDMSSKFAIMRAISKYQYEIQFAYYLDGAKACGLDVRQFGVIFVGTKEDCDVAKFTISKKSIEYGRAEYRNALVRYEQAMHGVRAGAFPFEEEIQGYYGIEEEAE